MAVPKKRTSAAKSRHRKAGWYANAWRTYAQRYDVYRMAYARAVRLLRAPRRAKAQGFGSSGVTNRTT